MIRLLIADDHQMFIDGVLAMLQSEEDIEVVHTVRNGLDAIVKMRESSVDIAILDITMPGMGGLEAAELIQKEFLDVKVLLLSMHDERRYIQQALEVGVSGYILKNADRSEFLQAIRTLVRGRSYYSGEVTEAIMRSNVESDEKANSQVQLTSRELEVLQLIAQEMTNEEIGEKLFLSVNTIKSHRKNLLSKLEVRNTAGLVLYAVKHDLLDD